MGAAQHFSPSSPIDLGYLETLVNGLSMAELGWKWKRSQHDSQRLELFNLSGFKLGCVWKSGGRWASTSGNSHDTQKEAKATLEADLRAQVIADLEAFEQYLIGFQAQARAVFDVKRELINDDTHYEMHHGTYDILNLVLTKVLKERIGVYLQNDDFVRRRETRDICGNAVAGFDIGTVRVMFIKPRVMHAYRGDRRGVRAQAMSIWTSTLDITGTTLSQHPAIPEPMEVPIHRLSQKILFDTLDTYIYDVLQKVRSVA